MKGARKEIKEGRVQRLCHEFSGLLAADHQRGQGDQRLLVAAAIPVSPGGDQKDRSPFVRHTNSAIFWDIVMLGDFNLLIVYRGTP